MLNVHQRGLERAQVLETRDGTEVRYVEGRHPPTSKTFPFRRANFAVKCTSAGKFTGKRSIRELLSGTP